MQISCMARNEIALELNTMNSVGFIDTSINTSISQRARLVL